MTTKKRPTKKRPTVKVEEKPKRAPRRTKKPPKTKAARTAVVRAEHIPATRAAGRNVELRRMAGIDYISDPEGRSVRWHYDRKDRPYKKEVSDGLFRKWSIDDKWSDRREQYWTEIENRMLDKMQDQILKDRLRDLKEMQEDRSYLNEYLRPLKDQDGGVLRHPPGHEHEGLPVFPLKMPSMDRFLKAMLDLDERIMLKRGEAITRSETIGSKTKVTATALDPVGSLMNISRAEARKLAQNLLRERMGERYEGVMDLVEDGATDDGEEDEGL